ncbi:MAG: shikimate kinase [Arenimonas sp.]
MNPASNVILIGPMGAGKTSIGKRLASLLGLHFVDADHRLEEITGVAVPLIFECEGEAGFRQRESQLINELCQGKNQLIATGGGAVLSAENRRQLQANGFVVYLQVTVEQQLERLSRDRSRPLLAGGDKREKLFGLSEVRHPLYLEIADLVYQSCDNQVSNAVAGLHQQLQHHWQRAEAA